MNLSLYCKTVGWVYQVVSEQNNDTKKRFNAKRPKVRETRVLFPSFVQQAEQAAAAGFFIPGIFLYISKIEEKVRTRL
jgi:hypothetical protein